MGGAATAAAEGGGCVRNGQGGVRGAQEGGIPKGIGCGLRGRPPLHTAGKPDTEPVCGEVRGVLWQWNGEGLEAHYGEGEVCWHWGAALGCDDCACGNYKGSGTPGGKVGDTDRDACGRLWVPPPHTV